MVITMRERIEQLKKEKDIVILAHYYVDGEVQEIADLVGDSYFLARCANARIVYVSVSGVSRTFSSLER